MNQHQTAERSVNWESPWKMLESLKNLLPKYPLGLKVRFEDKNELYTWVITGKICGFEYIDHPNYRQYGWSYFVNVETSQIQFRDGTTIPGLTDEFQVISEHSVEVI